MFSSVFVFVYEAQMFLYWLFVILCLYMVKANEQKDIK